MNEFKDKVVVVTGGAQGAGKKIATCFYEEGANVNILDIKEETISSLVKEIKPDKKRFTTYIADVSNSFQVDNAIKNIGNLYGNIDILINNAGVLQKSTIEESTDEHLNLMIGVNLLGPVYCTRAAIPYMKEKGGNIVNVSSILATFPNTGSGAYGAAKAGIIVLTRVWAAELAPYHIRVNAYAPGVINTPMAADIIEHRAESKLQQIALRRFAEPKDIFNVVKFYCSEQASYITGQTLGVDGGMWVTQTPTAAWHK
ncbi:MULTISPECIES: SDR family NAD(P)-dependent oxidoreductase [Tepidanaerobacter]|uniref:SDR family NAD(P)-dependent oxidoreductase n=1 Tax=Tepidanaerobacter TaxID=499228 RepID=UPI001BD3438A|nr:MULTISPECIES: SDR family NAD(P)-dependent oxidoreductase [Tepidanaerobacter]